MINRRDAIKAASAAIPLHALFAAQTAQHELLTRTTLMTQDVAGMDGRNLIVTVQQLEYAPGGTSEAHRHNGHTFVYVLAGKLMTQIDSGPVTTYETGQMFYEAPLHLHAVSANASQTEPAKFLVFRVVEKGKPPTVPAK